jgi:Mn-dependent DtxR family transcriptional regulator
MFLAFQVDCPPGPAMVLVATLMFVAAIVFAPQRGVLAERHRRRRVYEHIVEEDVLKVLVRQFKEAKVRVADLAEALKTVPAASFNRAIHRLVHEGFLLLESGRCMLTPSGRERAVALVRAHRIWETYLAEQNIADPELHEMAERLEHAHELTGELSVALGNPTVDPHGEPIPKPHDVSVPD